MSLLARDTVILRGSDRLRWGGDLRRRYLFQALEGLPRTSVVAGFGRADVRAALAPYRRRRWQVWRRGPAMLSTELLDTTLLTLVETIGAPLAVDIHDEPVAHARALQMELAPERVAELQDRLARNLRVFPRAIVQSETFRRQAGIAPEQAVIAPNGTDTQHIDVRPFPDEPTVAFSSGASPGRGIEQLVEAARLARQDVPSLRLQLWLVAGSDAGERFLADLHANTAGEPWITIAEVPYEALPEALGRASVHCVPNLPVPYWDGVLPIKLFDAMAAGRPVLVTPRVEMRAVVEAWEAGAVAAGDGPADLAASLVELLGDRDRMRRLGENARRAAEAEFDWRVISRRLAVALHLGT